MAEETTAAEKAMNDTMFDQDIWAATQTDNSPFIRFDPDIAKILTFTENDPYEIGENDYGNEVWSFNVIDAAGNEKVLDVAAMRLKKGLFQVQPLTEGEIIITRTGEGYETQYKVEKVDVGAI